jgi:hypothetical protein
VTMKTGERIAYRGSQPQATWVAAMFSRKSITVLLTLLKTLVSIPTVSARAARV